MRRSWGAKTTYVPVVKNAITLVLCVLIFVVPVQAVALGGTSSFAGLDGGPAANLNCLDESQSSISAQVGRLAGRTVDTLPDSVQSRVVGETLSIVVGESTYFAAEVSEGGTIERVRPVQAENPTVIVRTECETVANIKSSESRSAALERSISRGRIKVRGTNPTADTTVSYGSKGIQGYHIVQSSETGGIGDGANGFTSGLTYD